MYLPNSPMSITTEQPEVTTSLEQPLVDEIVRTELLRATKWLRGNVRRKIEWFSTPPPWLVDPKTGEDRVTLYSFDSFCPLKDQSDVEHHQRIDGALSILEQEASRPSVTINELCTAYRRVVTLNDQAIKEEAHSCRTYIREILGWNKGFVYLN